MISPEALARFARNFDTKTTVLNGTAFDIEGYLAKHEFTVTKRKPWGAHPGGVIYEIDQCPFDPAHIRGSAAFTLLNGKPGFRCQHNGCRGKTISDVFSRFGVDGEEEVSGAPYDESRVEVDNHKPTKSQLLVKFTADADLFHTPDGEAFASLPVGDHREIWPLKSKACRRWLARAFYLQLAKPPGAQVIQDALALLEAQAQFDSPEFRVYTRIAPHLDGVCIDLCNNKWEAVVITPNGWQVASFPPVRFRRSKGMLPLPYPEREGSVAALRKFINVGNEKDWLVLLSWLIAACQPQGPYPVLILQGEHGAAKSTTARLLRRLIDPSSAPLRTPPREERDLLIAASNSWLLAYDNLSGVPQRLSDALCRLATGGGFSARELYTDADEVIFDLMRPLILNGIDYLAERADLADRAIILDLPRIEETARQDEAHLYAEYERFLPKIFGALLDVISAALGRLPKTVLQRKPRMADFALLATAAEQGLGFPAGAFMDAYSGNRATAIRETLEADSVGAAVTMLMGSRGTIELWEGTCKELLKDLERLMPDETTKSEMWPKNPRRLSGRLRAIGQFLRESGVHVHFREAKGTGGRRILSITRTVADLTATTAPPEPLASANQSFTTAAPSGGSDDLTAAESQVGDKPPLKLAKQCMCQPQLAAKSHLKSPNGFRVDSVTEDEQPMSQTEGLVD